MHLQGNCIQGVGLLLEQCDTWITTLVFVGNIEMQGAPHLVRDMGEETPDLTLFGRMWRMCQVEMREARGVKCTDSKIEQ